jgi:hypothetical protein
LFRSLAIKEQRQVFYHRVRFDDDAERWPMTLCEVHTFSFRSANVDTSKAFCWQTQSKDSTVHEFVSSLRSIDSMTGFRVISMCESASSCASLKHALVKVDPLLQSTLPSPLSTAARVWPSSFSP